MTLGKTVAELEQTMSGRELSEWEAFSRLELIGPDRSDFNIAMLTSMLFNLFKNKKTKPATPMDYMPFLRKKKGVADEIKQVMEMFQ